MLPAAVEQVAYQPSWSYQWIASEGKDGYYLYRSFWSRTSDWQRSSWTQVGWLYNDGRYCAMGKDGTFGPMSDPPISRPKGVLNPKWFR